MAMRNILFSLFFPLLVSWSLADETVPGPVTLISYNIRQDTESDKDQKDWAQRKGMVSGYLLKKKAEVIGLQEVRHKQLLDLDKALPGHAFLGVGREDGKTRGEYSPIFYDRNAWNLDPEEHGTFWLSDTPGVANSRSWGNHHTRICTWARLIAADDPEKKTAIYIYNTHWDHQSQLARVNSALLMLKRIKARAHKEDPYILMGDLNATVKNPAVKSLLGQGLLKDHGKNQYRSSSKWKAGLVPGLRIDHIFTSPSIEADTLRVESNGNADDWSGSDHHPVVLRIKK
ncbi:MAG: endonuclease/exonuclease/phosphatase family protein [Verrucomicrobiales bacterium]|nr:endonuclease/exonuclease/phosphatase family protein [Verrucomicrobiales bacterium]